MKTRYLALATLLAAATFGAVQARDAFAPTPERALARISADLDLTTVQQARAQGLLQRAVRLRTQVRDGSTALLAASQAELARPDADLAALAAERQAWVDARLTEARALEADALVFYQRELTPTQQAAARARLGERLGRLAQLRERLQAWRDDPMFPL